MIHARACAATCAPDAGFRSGCYALGTWQLLFTSCAVELALVSLDGWQTKMLQGALGQRESDYLLITSKWKKSHLNSIWLPDYLITCIFQLPQWLYYSFLVSSSFILKTEIRGNQVIILFLNNFSREPGVTILSSCKIVLKLLTSIGLIKVSTNIAWMVICSTTIIYKQKLISNIFYE